MEHRGAFITFLYHITVLFSCAASSAYGKGPNPRAWNFKYTGVIIPGFASSRLRAWAMLDCPYTPWEFNPLDPVWLDTRKVMTATGCWLKCVMLDPQTQADHPECKTRTDTGLTAITELDPGYITGPLSSVWREWVNWCVEFGVQPDALVGVPYDWRLYPALLQERDLFFHKLQLVFEAARKLRGGPAVVFAHSMGNNVFRYFLEWLRREIPAESYQPWIDCHIIAYHAIAAPLLGAPETVKGMMTGITFGLPISEGTARLMASTFGGALWMLPFSPHCGGAHALSCARTPGSQQCPNEPPCGEGEYRRNASGWPVPVVSVEMLPINPDVAYPGVPLEAEVAAATQPVSVPVDRKYTARQVADGTMLHEIGHLDPSMATLAKNLRDWYLNDEVVNPLTMWERPPIKHVYCQYGINLKTEVGYSYSPSKNPFPENWQLNDVYYETEGGILKSRSGAPVYGNTFAASGDATVPYYSLSACKSWLGPRVNITRSPQAAYEGCDVQREMNVEHARGRDVVPRNFTRGVNGGKYITYYEDSESEPGRTTAVWELDKVDHRTIVKNKVLMREIWLQELHSDHPDASKPFVRKDYREPMRDEDCYWDYGKARCALQHCCEYRYMFGDVHLGQSCRLKANNDTDYFSRYL